MQNFTARYEFVSTRHDGSNTFATRQVKARSVKDALRFAGQIGFAEFGARFTENCIDWTITNA